MAAPQVTLNNQITAEIQRLPEQEQEFPGSGKPFFLPGCKNTIHGSPYRICDHSRSHHPDQYPVQDLPVLHADWRFDPVRAPRRVEP